MAPFKVLKPRVCYIQKSIYCRLPLLETPLTTGQWAMSLNVLTNEEVKMSFKNFTPDGK